MQKRHLQNPRKSKTEFANGKERAVNQSPEFCLVTWQVEHVLSCPTQEMKRTFPVVEMEGAVVWHFSLHVYFILSKPFR